MTAILLSPSLPLIRARGHYQALRDIALTMIQMGIIEAFISELQVKPFTTGSKNSPQTLQCFT